MSEKGLLLTSVVGTRLTLDSNKSLTGLELLRLDDRDLLDTDWATL